MAQTQNITSPAAETKRALDTYFGRLKHKRQLLTIMVLLLVSLVFWAILTLITSQKTTKVDTELTQLAKPINPVLKTEILDTLEDRRSFSESELQNFTIYRIVVDPVTQQERVMDINDELPEVSR